MRIIVIFNSTQISFASLFLGIYAEFSIRLEYIVYYIIRFKLFKVVCLLVLLDISIMLNAHH